MKLKLPHNQQEEFSATALIAASLIILAFKDDIGLAAAMVVAGLVVGVVYLLFCNIQGLPDVVDLGRKEEVVSNDRYHRMGYIPSRRRLLDVRLGVDSVRSVPTTINLVTSTHVAIYSQSGGGKTVTLYTLLYSIITNSPASRVQVAILDPKSYSFTIFGRAEHLWRAVAQGTGASVQLLRELDGELLRRERAFAELPQDRLCENLFDYHRIAAELGLNVEPLPFLVVVIDEVQEIAGVPEASALLTRLAKKGRALGFRLILATQRPTTAGLSHEIQSQLETKLVGTMDSRQEYSVARVPPEVYNVMQHQPGRFAMRYLGQWTHVQVDRMEPRMLETQLRRMGNGQAPEPLVVESRPADIVGVGLSGMDKKDMVVAWLVERGDLEKPTIAETMARFSVSQATASRYLQQYWPVALARLVVQGVQHEN